VSDLCLVTGGSGYFGCLLRDRLLERGRRVRVFDMVDADDRPREVEFVRGDIRDEAAVRAACEGADAIYHNVAQVPVAKDRQLFWSVNYGGTENLLGAALAARVQGLLSAVRAAAEYRAAVAAYATGDVAALAAALPAIFAGLEPVPRAPDLFYPLAWRRRGEPRPVAEIVAEVKRCRDEGVVAEGDDLAPGADPELPAVLLLGAAPPDEPVMLRFPSGACGEPVYRLADTGEFLVYAPRLRAPFTVLLRPTFETEDDEDTGAYPAWRAALAVALGAANVPVEEA